MHKNHTSHILQQYLDAKEKGKEPYFDAEDINDLLDSFEDSDDYTYFDEVLALGLKLHPHDTPLRVRECQKIVENEGYKKGLEAIEKLADPEDQDLNMLKIECYCALNQIPKISQLVEELKEKQCDYLEDIFEYVISLLNDYNLPHAANNFIKRGLEIFPKNIVLLNELCYIMEYNREFKEVVKICNQLIDQNPFNFEYWFTLGRQYSFLNEFDKALEAFDYALTCENTGNIIELKLLRAYCLYMNESYQKAVETYWEIYKDADKDMIRHIIPLMADCYIKSEEYEDAYTLLSDFLEKNKLSTDEGGPAQYLNLAHCCVMTNKSNELFDILQTATTLYPGNLRLLTFYCFHLLEQDKYKKALSVLGLALERPAIIGTNHEVINLLTEGHKFLCENKADEAIELFKKALEINPESVITHISLATTYFNLEDIKRFKDHLEAAGLVKKEQEFLEEEKALEKTNNYLDDDQLIEPISLALQYINNSDNNN